MKYLYYDDITGEIEHWGLVPGTTVPEAPTGKTCIEHDLDFPPNYYWNGQQLTAKVQITATWDKTEITADGIDEANLTGLPNCTVLVDAVPYLVIGGTFTLSATTPGVYQVIISDAAYTFRSWEITAV